MKKSFCFCLLFLCSYAPFLFAKTCPYPQPPLLKNGIIPISYTFTNKATVLYLSSSCSGLINDAVAGEGVLTLSVQGRIQNKQVSLQTKVNYKGSAITTVEGTNYQINGNISSAETKEITTDPVDIFIKGTYKLAGKNKSPNLYLGDIGYITVYPDGTIVSHILDPGNDPDYSRPKIYCSNPAEGVSVSGQ